MLFDIHTPQSDQQETEACERGHDYLGCGSAQRASYLPESLSSRECHRNLTVGLVLRFQVGEHARVSAALLLLTCTN